MTKSGQPITFHRETICRKKTYFGLIEWSKSRVARWRKILRKNPPRSPKSSLSVDSKALLTLLEYNRCIISTFIKTDPIKGLKRCSYLYSLLP